MCFLSVKKLKQKRGDEGHQQQLSLWRRRGEEEEVYLPFLTVSFVGLQQGGAPAVVLALQLGAACRLLLDELRHLLLVLPHQLLHLLVLLPLLSHEALLLLQLLQRLSLQLW